jgi:hypothetical protein
MTPAPTATADAPDPIEAVLRAHAEWLAARVRLEAAIESLPDRHRPLARQLVGLPARVRATSGRPPDPFGMPERIISALADSPDGMTAAEVAAAANFPPGPNEKYPLKNLRTTLAAMTRVGRLVRLARGRYALPPDNPEQP